MNRRMGVWAALSLLAFVALALTQDIDKPLVPGTGTKQVQRVSMAPQAPVTVRAGASAPVQLAFRVSPGFHINSNHPNSELLLPTTLKLSPPTDIGVGKVTYPNGQELSFAFAPGEKLNVYTGDFTIGALVSVTRIAHPGTYRVHGELKYQACDNKACYPPTQVPVAFDVRVAKAAKRARRNPAQSPHVHQ